MTVLAWCDKCNTLLQSIQSCSRWSRLFTSLVFMPLSTWSIRHKELVEGTPLPSDPSIFISDAAHVSRAGAGCKSTLYSKVLCLVLIDCRGAEAERSKFNVRLAIDFLPSDLDTVAAIVDNHCYVWPNMQKYGPSVFTYSNSPMSGNCSTYGNFDCANS